MCSKVNLMHKNQNPINNNLIYKIPVAIKKLLDSYCFFTLKIPVKCSTFVKILNIYIVEYYIIVKCLLLSIHQLYIAILLNLK